MVLLLIGGAIVTGLAAGAAGTGAYTYHRYKKRKALKGNLLFGSPLVSIPESFLSPEKIPNIIEKCCTELESRNQTLPIIWEAIFRDADPPIVEDKIETINLISEFSDTRKQKKIKLENYTVQDIVEMLLYYISSLPEPLFTFGLFDEIIKLQHDFEQKDKNIDFWVNSCADLLYKVPTIHKDTILRFFRMCNSVIVAMSDKNDQEVLIKEIAKKIILFFLHPRTPTEEAVQSLNRYGEPFLVTLLMNYDLIITTSLEKSFVAE